MQICTKTNCCNITLKINSNKINNEIHSSSNIYFLCQMTGQLHGNKYNNEPRTGVYNGV